MFLGQNREYQYNPGIEKILLDVIGGGTIDRSDLRSAVPRERLMSYRRSPQW